MEPWYEIERYDFCNSWHCVSVSSLIRRADIKWNTLITEVERWHALTTNDADTPQFGASICEVRHKLGFLKKEIDDLLQVNNIVNHTPERFPGTVGPSSFCPDASGRH